MSNKARFAFFSILYSLPFAIVSLVLVTFHPQVIGIVLGSLSFPVGTAIYKARIKRKLKKIDRKYWDRMPVTPMSGDNAKLIQSAIGAGVIDPYFHPIAHCDKCGASWRQKPEDGEHICY